MASPCSRTQPQTWLSRLDLQYLRFLLETKCAFFGSKHHSFQRVLVRKPRTVNISSPLSSLRRPVSTPNTEKAANPQSLCTKRRWAVYAEECETMAPETYPQREEPSCKTFLTRTQRPFPSLQLGGHEHEFKRLAKGHVANIQRHSPSSQSPDTLQSQPLSNHQRKCKVLPSGGRRWRPCR